MRHILSFECSPHAKKQVSSLFRIFYIVAYYGCSKKDVIATINDKDYKTLGTSYANLLASSIYTSLKIEIQYMPGYEQML